VLLPNWSRKYAKYICYFGAIMSIIYLLALLYVAYHWLLKEAPAIDDFTYSYITEERYLLEVAEESQHIFITMSEADFPAEKQKLLSIITRDRNMELRLTLYRTAGYLALYLLVFFLHYNIIRNSKG
tara:strand:- start:5005 stop:5385 length:381 start_codon:yes stop_codon:yes gene_type:complete